MGAGSGSVLVRHFRLRDFSLGCIALARHAPLQTRTEDSRRLDARGPHLGGAAGGRWVSVVELSAHQFHRGLFRSGFRTHHHGRHGALGPRVPAALHQFVAPFAQLARRHGNHRARSGDTANARRRWHANLSRRDAGADEGHQTHAAHRTDGQAPVGRVRRTHGSMRGVPEVRGHGLVRRGLPWLLRARASGTSIPCPSRWC
jgi:hypothetical protein